MPLELNINLVSFAGKKQISVKLFKNPQTCDRISFWKFNIEVDGSKNNPTNDITYTQILEDEVGGGASSFDSNTLRETLLDDGSQSSNSTMASVSDSKFCTTGKYNRYNYYQDKNSTLKCFFSEREGGELDTDSSDVETECRTDKKRFSADEITYDSDSGTKYIFMECTIVTMIKVNNESCMVFF